jgi:3,4-dihydroxy 2-butanone 4-phosphate synthase/GTP cyclohydrolase II
MEGECSGDVIATIEESCEELREGKFIILVDDEDRENEGDLVMAAEMITPEAVNFMEKHARGWICVPLPRERLQILKIPLMVRDNTSRFSTAFTVTVDYKYGTTTGISASDQATTIRALVDEKSTAQDFAQPGHVCPIQAVDGGVLKRAGHTEASLDLVRLAGMKAGSVICEVKKEDGSMARLPDLMPFAEEHDIKIVTIADLIAYRRRNEKLIEKIARADLPTRAGDFEVVAFRSIVDDDSYIALVKEPVEDGALVRVHSACLTGDVFHSQRCDCGEQLEAALNRIGEEGGILLYIQSHEGRGIGLLNKIKAYELQDHGLDTLEANEALGFKEDLRDYGIGAQILGELGAKRISLMTNNPRKIVGLESYGLEVIEVVPLEVFPNRNNSSYLKIKKDKMGHILSKV